MTLNCSWTDGSCCVLKRVTAVRAFTVCTWSHGTYCSCAGFCFLFLFLIQHSYILCTHMMFTFPDGSFFCLNWWKALFYDIHWLHLTFLRTNRVQNNRTKVNKRKKSWIETWIKDAHKMIQNMITCNYFLAYLQKRTQNLKTFIEPYRTYSCSSRSP